MMIRYYETADGCEKAVSGSVLIGGSASPMSIPEIQVGADRVHGTEHLSCLDSASAAVVPVPGDGNNEP